MHIVITKTHNDYILQLMFEGESNQQNGDFCGERFLYGHETEMKKTIKFLREKTYNITCSNDGLFNTNRYDWVPGKGIIELNGNKDMIQRCLQDLYEEKLITVEDYSNAISTLSPRPQTSMCRIL